MLFKASVIQTWRPVSNLLMLSLVSTDVKRPHDSFLSDLPQSRVVCMEDARLSVNTSANNSKPNRMNLWYQFEHLLKMSDKFESQ